jgi:hypothetical protein
VTSRRLPILLLAVAVACTADPAADPAIGPEPTGPTSPTSAPATGPVIPVVVAAGADRTYLDGAQLAADQVGLRLDVREASGSISDALREAVAAGAPAVFLAGSAQAAVQARPDVEQAGVPVVLLGGDLYTDRLLYRHVFQTAVPLRWQARVLARYFVADRGYERIAVVGDVEAGAAALAEEGVSAAATVEDAQAVMALGRGVPVATAGQAGVSWAIGRDLPAGTVTPAPYTWAGWADMLPRVHRFRTRFERAFGRLPAGSEQEGYDAVRALADALERTGGQGGDALIDALESFREETYSSLPIRLGPDDHVLAEESQLGLFAVAAPDEQPAPGEAVGPVPWRPVMRTFTTDGQKVNLIDRDKKVFFPGWHRRKPSPRYWKSLFGIVTRPDEDPLH